MKILFIHEVGYFSKPIFEMHEFPESLASLGHEVSFLDFEEDSKFRRKNFATEVQGRTMPGVSLTLFRGEFFGGNILSRIFSAISAAPILCVALRRARPDVVVCYSVPTFGWQAGLICKAFGHPLIFRAIDVSHKLRNSVLNPLVLLAERATLRLATATSFNNLALQRYLTSSTSQTYLHRVHLPPLKFKGPLARTNDSNRKFGLGPIRVVFLGTLFTFSGLRELISEWPDHLRSRIKLIIAGDGPDYEKLESLTLNMGLQESVDFVGFVPFQDIAKLFADSDIGILPFRKDLVTDCALPNKLLQYLSAGLPVISSDLEGARTLIGEDAGVIWCQNTQEMWEAAETLLDSHFIREEMGQLGHKRVLEIFDFREHNNKQVFEFQEYVLKIAKGEK